jgi:hypothetical protein
MLSSRGAHAVAIASTVMMMCTPHNWWHGNHVRGTNFRQAVATVIR